MVLATALVYAEGLEDLVKIMARLFAVLLPPVALPMAAGLLSNRVSGRGAIAGFAIGAVCGIGAWILSANFESLEWLGTVPWLTWISILPTAAGLGLGSLLWPDATEKRLQIDEFLSGLSDTAPSASDAPDPRDGLYAMYIIGMTCTLLGGLIVLAVLALASASDAWLTLLVGLLFALGGGAASWRAKNRLTNLGKENNG